MPRSFPQTLELSPHCARAESIANGHPQQQGRRDVNDVFPGHDDLLAPGARKRRGGDEHYSKNGSPKGVKPKRMTLPQLASGSLESALSSFSICAWAARVLRQVKNTNTSTQSHIIA